MIHVVLVGEDFATENWETNGKALGAGSGMMLWLASGKKVSH